MLMRAYPAPDSNPKHPNSSRDSNFYHNIFSNRAVKLPKFNHIQKEVLKSLVKLVFL